MRKELKARRDFSGFLLCRMLDLWPTMCSVTGMMYFHCTFVDRVVIIFFLRKFYQFELLYRPLLLLNVCMFIFSEKS